VLLCDLVRALARGVLGRLDHLASFAAQKADESAQKADESTHRMQLPARGGHDLGQGRTLGALHHRDHLGLLVGAIRFGFAGLLLLVGLPS
jgi:hypothetical protein